MVTFLGFFKQREVLIEQRFLRERDTIDTRHHRTFLIATPVGSGAREHFDRLNGFGTQEVRTTAEVGEGTLRISGNMSVL